VTSVGHAELTQYLPGLTAPVQGMRSLVEPVAALLIGAGPAAAGVGFHHDHWPSHPGGRGRSRQTGQPRPDYDNWMSVIFLHTDMTPSRRLL
jgi:hypothetical protein